MLVNVKSADSYFSDAKVETHYIFIAYVPETVVEGCNVDVLLG
jgi:hypothetical protein